MPVHNAEIAETLNELADLLEIEGENPYKIRAYRNAARSIENYTENIASLIQAGRTLPHLPGVGESIGNKIDEIVKTGHLEKLAHLEQKLSGHLAELVAIPGLGPKRVKILHEKLGINNLEDLSRALESKAIREIPGFGEKTEAHIQHELERRQQSRPRLKLAFAEQIATSLLDYIHTIEGIKNAIIAGSFRRRLETVGDLDILITCKTGSNAMKEVILYEDVEETVSQGETRSTVRLRSGLQVDIRVVPDASYGAALLYFTGSKSHNIVIRTMAVQKGLKINEYGVFKDDTQVAGKTEESVYAQVDLPYIEPELRENRGEIEAAQKNQLPKLIQIADIVGDLHVHTKASDGSYTLEEMAMAAQRRGYQYIAITEHTQQTRIAHGLDEKRLTERLKRIDRLNEKQSGFLILKSAEVDILEDGTLDLPNRILKELDLTVCSVHSNFNLSLKKQTERIVRAMDNPYFNILGHPTGRLIGEREPYAVDLKQIMDAASERGCYLELNAQPDRLDLRDIDCKAAKDFGIKVAISSDAHKISDFNNMRYGVDQARRGWLEASDALNTRPWETLQRVLQRI